MHSEKAPVLAVRKLETHSSNIGKMTVPEIESILYQVYIITMSGFKLSRKPDYDYVKALEKKIESNIGK